MIKFLNIIFILILMMPFPTQAQNKKYTENPVALNHSSNFLPKTIIIKLKPQFRHFAGENKIKLPAAEKALKDLKIITAEKMFPGAQPPAEHKNKFGQNYVDISLIYILKYQAEIDVLEAIERIKDSPALEYANPYFIEDIQFTTEEDKYIPNDPKAAEMFYLDRVKAYEAWNVTKGDSNIVIGIVDTGINFDHEDLKDNVAINTGETGTDSEGNDKRTNGIDDDGDGYIDNWRGWDFGENDNNPTYTGSVHGVMVTGCSSAKTDNGKGIAGTGFKSKYLPIKASADNSGGSIGYGYQGLVYAADQGAKVINLSWGGASTFNQTAQDIINYAAINKDAVIVGAAGNVHGEYNYYPASYENILSVAGCDTSYSARAGRVIDIKWANATYSYFVDLCAQGRRISTTLADGFYSGTNSGSSFSTPLVAGAAALVRAKFPELNALQVGQLLRVTGDIIDTIQENREYRGKIGRRLNMYNAVTDSLTPAVRMTKVDFHNRKGKYAFSGDTINVVNSFFNYLHPTENLNIKLTALSDKIIMIDSIINLGAINTLDSTTNLQNPFKLYITQELQGNQEVPFLLEYFDGNYYDYQYFKYKINPQFIEIDTNDIRITVTSNGRLGFNNAQTSQGSGFKYQDQSLLFEAGLMIGNKSTTQTKVSDCVRSSPSGTFDRDFSAISTVKYNSKTPGDQGTVAILSDKNAPAPIGVKIKQETYGWNIPGLENFLITEYEIENYSDKTFDTLHIGIYADWDIMDYASNRAGWDADTRTGYVFSSENNSPYAGISVLTPWTASCYSLDHSNIGGNNINPVKNAGFSTDEKYRALSRGIGRARAGESGAGNDVSQVTGTTITNLAPGKRKTVAFAIVGAKDLYHLKMSAKEAFKKYKEIRTGPVPEIEDIEICSGDTTLVTVSPSGGQMFNFYKTWPGTAVYKGKSYQYKAWRTDTLFITNHDSIFESEPVRFIIREKDIVSDFIAEENINYNTTPHINLTALVDDASDLIWKTSDGNSYNGSNFEYTFPEAGTYTVSLTAVNEIGCSDTLSKTINLLQPGPIPVVEDLTWCSNNTTELEIKPENGKTFNFYSKYPGTAEYTGSTLVISGLTESRTYYVTNIDSVYESEAAEVKITLYDKASADFIAVPETLDLASSSDVYFVSRTDGENTFSWTINGLAEGNDEILQKEFLNPGVYEISLNIKNSKGCTDTKTIFYPVVLTTSILNQEKELLEIYPNPTDKKFTIRYHNLSSTPAIQITDLSGKEIKYTKTTYQNSEEINLENAVPGIYLAKIILADKIIIRKVIKR